MEPIYLTAELSGVPGAIKRRPEDFRVDEVPLYEPAGEGAHTYLCLEKRGVDTPGAIRALARALDRRPREFGYAGLKDARAVTTQWVSIEHVDPGCVRALELKGLRVLEVARHRNKLRRGHLAANRFAIRLRDTDTGRADDAAAVLETLARRGMPNAFGPQRFGHRGDADRIGAALLAGDDEEALGLLCGRPSERDTGPVLAARQLYEEGRWQEAAAIFPRGYHDAGRACAALARTGGDRAAAVGTLDERMRTLLVSAWQSRQFNEVLAARMRAPDLSIEVAVPGDIAILHGSGGAFLVGEGDAQDAAARSATPEISPSGPLPGPRTLRPEGRPREAEDAVVGAALANDELVGCVGRCGCRGGRRPLRAFPTDGAVEPGEDEHGAFLELRFTLPRGSYATALLREVCKDECA